MKEYLDKAHALGMKFWNLHFPLAYLSPDDSAVIMLRDELASIRIEALKEASVCYQELREWAWEHPEELGGAEWDRMIERHEAILAGEVKE